MAINKINSKSIEDLDLSADDLAPGTITDAKIATGTIANNKLANNNITINGTSIALGASGDIVAGTDWQAVTVADGSTTVNATAGQGYFLDTNAGVIEVFLPTSPTQGDTVILIDYAGTFATNNVIVNTGGVAIDSTIGSDFILSTNNRIAEFVYVDSNKGWLYKGATVKGSTPSQAGVPIYDSDTTYISATGGTITTSGDFKIHTFTGDGCFVVSQIGEGDGPSVVDYLVVAGGGGSTPSSAGPASGGAGGGGYRESKSGCSGCWTSSPLVNPTGVTVTATTYPIVVGAGGSVPRTPGSPSSGLGITSTGGGEAGIGGSGGTGGSGGGGGGGPTGAGGSGNTPPVSPPQGNNGGNGDPSPPGSAGGGGGAGGVGDAGSGAGSGDSGPGTPTNFTGTSIFYSAGGVAIGHGNPPGSATCGATPLGTPGTANRGTGGPTGTTGGKGIVVIRYKFQ